MPFLAADTQLFLLPLPTSQLHPKHWERLFVISFADKNDDESDEASDPVNIDGIESRINPSQISPTGIIAIVISVLVLVGKCFRDTIYADNWYIHMSHFAYACKMRYPLNLVLEVGNISGSTELFAL